MAAMNRSTRIFVAALAALVAGLPTAAHAQDKAQDKAQSASQNLEQSQSELTWYAVEVIVFERTSEIGRSAESWPLDPGLPDVAGAVEISAEGISPALPASDPAAPTSDTAGEPPATSAMEVQSAMPRAFRRIPPSQYRLTEAWKRLDKSTAYRPLLRLGWIQPGYSAENARRVHLRNDNAALGAVSTVTGELPEALPALGEPANAPTLSSPVRVARDRSKSAIDGTLRVHRARYLHVQADLLYYRPLANAPMASGDGVATAALPNSPDTALIEQLLAEDDATPRLFRLSETRRMRSRELHYLDHPLFGVLVEIWPIELPETPVTPTQTPPAAQGDVSTDQGDKAAQPAPVPVAPAQGASGG
jgi:hypothetical protein